MKIYFAGSYTSRELDILAEQKCGIMQNWSTADMSDPIWKKIRTGEIDDIIFDSGGFQLQTGTKTLRNISLEHYALWLELVSRNYPNIKYLNLDIRGKPEKTVENIIYLESCGLKPIPVFHASYMDVYDVYLDFYCNNYEYIAIGDIASGRNTLTTIKLCEYLAQKYPKTKFHLLGIGLAASRICRIFKPYSIDSSTWLAPARWGQEIYFDGNDLKSRDMSAEDKKAIRKNDDVRTIWSRKSILATKEFERSVSNRQIDISQPNMFCIGD